MEPACPPSLLPRSRPTAEASRKPEEKGTCCSNLAGQPSGPRAGWRGNLGKEVEQKEDASTAGQGSAKSEGQEMEGHPRARPKVGKASCVKLWEMLH